MAKEFAKSFYKSKAWKKCREGYIKSVFGLCERCKRPGYIVHHKTKLTPNNINDLYLTLSWENLEYLCQDCHNKEHHSNHKEITREGLMFDEKGNLIQSPL
ncbi:HNH endonuclease [Marinisporobacter balticus]|uniref:HNH endonuclease n=1 Tax=Marinisporobacter balticus TaxID=2018667 RepID=A0A4R2K832_9FIRM|nr:HNH endonuclease [Marinisporobacter balticus]TCO69513.1 HNH endonuclease [Marinisporobacter balticus]